MAGRRSGAIFKKRRIRPRWAAAPRPLPLLKKSYSQVTDPSRSKRDAKDSQASSRIFWTGPMRRSSSSALLNRDFPQDPEVLPTHEHPRLLRSFNHAARRLTHSAPNSYSAHELNAEDTQSCKASRTMPEGIPADPEANPDLRHPLPPGTFAALEAEPAPRRSRASPQGI